MVAFEGQVKKRKKETIATLASVSKQEYNFIIYLYKNKLLDKILMKYIMLGLENSR